MINISEKILVGLTQPNNNKLPTTTISPIGKTSGEKNKMARIRKDYKDVRELENTPLPGFTLTSCGRNSWGSTETIWNVIDPRGFTSTITSSNLEQILHCTGITEGLIQEKCVWARENDRITMVLLPVNAPDYTEAVANTELISNKVSKREIKLGDKVLLQNKLIGAYFGTATLYGPCQIATKDLVIKPCIIGRRQILEVTPNAYYFQSDLKILSLTEPREIAHTKIEASAILSTALENGALFSPYEDLLNSTTSSYYRERVRHVSYPVCTENDMSFTREEVSEQEAIALFDLSTNCFDCAVLMLEDATGASHLIDVPTSEYSRKRDQFSKDNFKAFETQLVGGQLKISPKYKVISKYSTSMDFPKISRKLTDFVKYYKIVKHTKTETFI